MHFIKQSSHEWAPSASGKLRTDSQFCDEMKTTTLETATLNCGTISCTTDPGFLPSVISSLSAVGGAVFTTGTNVTGVSLFPVTSDYGVDLGFMKIVCMSIRVTSTAATASVAGINLNNWAEVVMDATNPIFGVINPAVPANSSDHWIRHNTGNAAVEFGFTPTAGGDHDFNIIVFQLCH